MLSLSLLTLYLAAISAYAKPMVHAVTGLEISLSTPADKVASVSELRVVATVKNVRDEDLKILKLGTVLDNEHPTRSFFVTKDGKQVPFTGIEVPVVTERVSERYWTIIPAGKGVTTEHNVSALYDFSATDPGTFIFDPVSSFQVTRLNDTDEIISDPVVINAEKAGPISITVTDHVSKRELGLEKRVAVDCTDLRKEWTIFLSFLDAKQLASEASSYIRSHGADKYYKKYFRDGFTERVIDNFDTIANQTWEKWTTSCSTTYCNFGDGVIYDLHGTIHYCDPFYTLPSLSSFCNDNDHYPRGALNLRELSLLLKQTHKTVHNDCAYPLHDALDPMDYSDTYSCFAAYIYSGTKCNKW